jgi:hypothetical protein
MKKMMRKMSDKIKLTLVMILIATLGILIQFFC